MSLRMSSYYRPCTKIYRQRLMMRFRGKIGNNVQFWHYCVYVYLGCKWAPSAPVWWLDGRRVHSRAPQRCPGPSVWFDACRGSVLTRRGKDLRAADPGGKDLRAAKAVVACMFSQRFLSAWRNLFELRSKVYRWSIHGSISCFNQLL